MNFSKREFMTEEAARMLVERFDLLGFQGMNLKSTRLRTKLVSNQLGKLRSWKLADTRRAPRLVTTKSGKRVKRGFKYLWHLTPKAFVFLRTTKRDSLDTKGLLEAFRREQQRSFIREDPNFVYSRVLSLRLEIDALIYSQGRLKPADSVRMYQKAKELTDLMNEITRQKNPRKDVLEAVRRAQDEARHFHELKYTL